MANTIEVLDAPMGVGKTTAIINWMLADTTNKYLYVSPMLSEVEERIPEACAALEFVFPNTEFCKTKSEHLLTLLKEERNVAFTHSLFKDLSKEHLKEIARVGYVLIIDEEVGLIEPYNGRYKKGDIISLEKAGHIKVDESNMGKVEWLWDDMEGYTQYSDLKRLCSVNMLYCSKRNRDMMVVQLPISLVDSSKRTIVLTYLFKGSVMESFLKLRGFEYTTFDEVVLLKNPKEVLEQAKALISVCNTTSTDQVKRLSMSSTWYSQSATQKQLSKVGAAIRSVYRKVVKDCGDRKEARDKILLTLPKDSSSALITGKGGKRMVIPKEVSGVQDMFLYCGARATNDFADKSVVIHAYNRFVNLTVKSYLQDYGVDSGAVPDDDLFALSEMVQFIWRSRVRKDQPIEVYILPKRMEDLFIKWLNGGFEWQ